MFYYQSPPGVVEDADDGNDGNDGDEDDTTILTYIFSYVGRFNQKKVKH